MFVAAWATVRWVLLATSWVAGAGVATPASDALVQDLRATMREEDAIKLIESHTGFDVKKLDAPVIEQIVSRQWWGLAKDIVARSHKQSVDVSFAVRKAVKILKDEADELVRTLNPKYGQAQQVAPAFQWAQNDTCVFLTVKFTVRWNAPGALEVTEPKVHIQDNSFNFTGLGQHSNNKYLYSLRLRLFDYLVTEESEWNAASVGKLSVTLKKRWARKWPRLLADKKAKIGNMHVWMETQERLDSALSGYSTVAHSPVTCKAAQKVYCIVTDTCKLNCTTCPGKEELSTAEDACTGAPSNKAEITFKDADMDENEIGGTINITRERSQFDVENYMVYWGTDMSNKLLLPNGSAASAVGNFKSAGAKTQFALDANTKIPEGANVTHLLVYSVNTHGEFATPGYCKVEDAYIPTKKARQVTFDDEDGEEGEYKGTVRIQPAEEERTIDSYGVYWGRSPTKKAGASAHISDVEKTKPGQPLPTYSISENTIPSLGGIVPTHLLVFSKNTHGENPSPVSVKLKDNMKPCLKPKWDDCPGEVTITNPSQRETKLHLITITRAKVETSVKEYKLYFGWDSCDGTSTQVAKMGTGSPITTLFIEQLPEDMKAGAPLTYELPADVLVPDGTSHIVVTTNNDWGESFYCASQGFELDGRLNPAPATESVGPTHVEPGNDALLEGLSKLAQMKKGSEL
jgi:hypothetical protein